MAKITQATSRTRVLAVQELLLSGSSRAEIHAYCHEQWNIETRQADEYIQKANELIQDITRGDAEACLEIITKNLWVMFKIYKDKGELSAAHAVLLDIANLRGLDKININLKINRPLKDLSNEELAKAMSEHV